MIGFSFALIAFAAPPVEEPEPLEDVAPAEEPAPVMVPPAPADPSLSIEDVFGDSTREPVTKGVEGAVVAPKPVETPDQVQSDKRAHLGDLAGGKLDLRLKIVSSIYVDIDNVHGGRRWSRQYGEAGNVSRNENRLELYASYSPNKHIQIVADIEPVFFGVAPASTLNDLASRQMLEPFHVESDAAYVAVHDIVPGLDIRLGRQIVVWGTADKFNPTNNINPDDLEDRPLFTEPIANQMAVVDFAPIGDKLWFQGVYVPLFYPALLPPSAAAALQDPKSPVPFTDKADLQAIDYLQGYVDTNPRFTPDVVAGIAQPPHNLKHGQAAFKIGSSLGDIDLSASYYFGYHDIPLPYEAKSSQTWPTNWEMNDPDLGPPPNGLYFRSDVTLIYPRMHVVGADFAAQVPFLDNLGIWGEGALIIPDQQYDFRIQLPLELDVTQGQYDDGIDNKITQVQGPTVLARPFVKATTGMDYSIGKHLYLQAQYLRGFIDEFGAGHIGNYLVAGTDLVFFGRHIVFRLFGVTDFPKDAKDHASFVLYPNLILVPPWGFVTLEVGGFALFGATDTKFGQTGAGSSIAFTKISGQF